MSSKIVKKCGKHGALTAKDCYGPIVCLDGGYISSNKKKVKEYSKAHYQLKKGNPEPMRIYKEKYGKKDD